MKSILMFTAVLVVTILCTAKSSEASYNACLWCDDKVSEKFMNCVIQRVKRNPNFMQIDTETLDGMKSAMLGASKAMKVSKPTEDNAMKGAFIYGVTQLIDMCGRSDKKIEQMKRMVQSCYPVDDKAFFDNFSESIKIALEEIGNTSKAQQPKDQVDETSQAGENVQYLSQDKNGSQQQATVLNPDANNFQQKSQQNEYLPAKQKQIQYENAPKPKENILTPESNDFYPGQGTNQWNVPPFIYQQQSAPYGSAIQTQDSNTFANANSFYPSQKNYQWNGFLSKEQQQSQKQNVPQKINTNQGNTNSFAFSTGNSYDASYGANQQPSNQKNFNLWNAQGNQRFNPYNGYNGQYNNQGNLNTYQNNPINNDERFPIWNDRQNSQLYAQNFAYSIQDQSQNVKNEQYSKGNYPESQYDLRNKALNSAFANEYNPLQINNAPISKSLDSSALAQEPIQSVYYDPQTPKPGFNTKQQNVQSAMNDKTVNALKFSKTCYGNICNEDPFKKCFHNFTTNRQATTMMSYITPTALRICGYSEKDVQEITKGIPSFMKGFPEKSSTREWAEAICKMLMIQFNSKNLIRKNDPEGQAKDLVNTMLISLQRIETYKNNQRLQNNRNNSDVSPATEQNLPSYQTKNVKYYKNYPNSYLQSEVQNQTIADNRGTNSAGAIAGASSDASSAAASSSAANSAAASSAAASSAAASYSAANSAAASSAAASSAAGSGAVAGSGANSAAAAGNGGTKEGSGIGTGNSAAAGASSGVFDATPSSANGNDGATGARSPAAGAAESGSGVGASSATAGATDNNSTSSDVDDDWDDDTIWDDDGFWDDDDGLDDDGKITIPSQQSIKQNNYPIDDQQNSTPSDIGKKNVNTTPSTPEVTKATVSPQNPNKQTNLFNYNPSALYLDRTNDDKKPDSIKSIQVAQDDASKDRIEKFKKLAVGCIDNDKYNYEKFVDGMIESIKDVQKNNESKKALITVLLEVIFAFTQLLLRSKMEGIYKQPQQIEKPIQIPLNFQEKNNQQNNGNLQLKNLNSNYKIGQTNEYSKPVMQNEPVYKPVVDSVTEKKNIYPRQDEVQKSKSKNGYQNNPNLNPTIQDAPKSQMEPIYTYSFPQQTISKVPQNEVQGKNWNFGNRAWQNNLSDNNNANSQQKVLLTPGRVNPSEGNRNLNEEIFPISAGANSYSGVPNAQAIQNSFDNQVNSASFQEERTSTPRLMRNGNQGSAGYLQQSGAGILNSAQQERQSDWVQSMQSDRRLIQNIADVNQDIANVVPGNQGDRAPNPQNGQGNLNMVQNGFEGNFPISQQSTNAQNWMQAGDQRDKNVAPKNQNNLVFYPQNGQGNPNSVQNGIQSNFAFPQQNMNDQRFKSNIAQGEQGNWAPYTQNGQGSQNPVQSGSQGNWPSSQQNGMKDQNFMGPVNQGMGIGVPGNQDIGTAIPTTQNSQPNSFLQNSPSPQSNQQNWGSSFPFIPVNGIGDVNLSNRGFGKAFQAENAPKNNLPPQNNWGSSFPFRQVNPGFIP